MRKIRNWLKYTLKRFLVAWDIIMWVGLYRAYNATDHLALQFRYQGADWEVWMRPLSGGKSYLQIIEEKEAEIAALKKQLTEGAN
jgi:hypothetical protein